MFKTGQKQIHKELSHNIVEALKQALYSFKRLDKTSKKDLRRAQSQKDPTIKKVQLQTIKSARKAALNYTLHHFLSVLQQAGFQPSLISAVQMRQKDINDPKNKKVIKKARQFLKKFARVVGRPKRHLKKRKSSQGLTAAKKKKNSHKGKGYHRRHSKAHKRHHRRHKKHGVKRHKHHDKHRRHHHHKHKRYHTKLIKHTIHKVLRKKRISHTAFKKLNLKKNKKYKDSLIRIVSKKVIKRLMKIHHLKLGGYLWEYKKYELKKGLGKRDLKKEVKRQTKKILSNYARRHVRRKHHIRKRHSKGHGKKHQATNTHSGKRSSRRLQANRGHHKKQGRHSKKHRKHHKKQGKHHLKRRHHKKHGIHQRKHHKHHRGKCSKRQLKKLARNFVRLYGNKEQVKRVNKRVNRGFKKQTQKVTVSKVTENK